MKNFTKAFLIPLLMSGSFMVNAAEYTDEEMAAMATHCEMSVSDLRELGKSMSLEDFYKPVAHLFDRDSSKLAEQLNRWMITTRQDEPVTFQNRHFSHTPHASEMANTAGYSDEQMVAMAQRHAMAVSDLRELEKTMSLAEFYAPVSHQFAPQPQEDTSNDHQFALDLDRKEREDRNRKAEDRANTDYLRSLQEREAKAAENYRLTLQLLEAEEQAAAPAWVPQTPFRNAIQDLSWDFSHEPAKQAILKNFMGISKELGDIFNHNSEDMHTNKSLNVHALDNYVFGSRKAISDLLAVGRLYGAEQPAFNLVAVGQEMMGFVTNTENKKFFDFDSYKYETLTPNGYLEITLNSNQIIAYLTSHFSNMDKEIAGYGDEVREVWSRAWTLALNLYQKDDNKDAIRIIYDRALEGALTNGGCLAGRIGRGFLTYFDLLGKAGVTLHQSYIGFDG